MSSNFTNKLQVYANAGYALIGVETHEEKRVKNEIASIVPLLSTQIADKPVSYVLYEWTRVLGLIKYTVGDKKPEIVSNVADYAKILPAINGIDVPAIFVLSDFHPAFKNPENIRMLRELGNIMSGKHQTLILVSPRLDLPLDLKKDVQMMEFALPTRVELNLMLKLFLDNTIKVQPAYKDLTLSEAEQTAIVESAAGMTSLEFENALSSCVIMQGSKITMTGDFAKNIFNEKISNLRTGFLEHLPETPGFQDVGGLNVVKSWALARRAGFEAPARELHLPYPKGVILAGFKGCGKTLVATAIASAFGFPLFKLDMGRIFGSKVGESEGNIQELIRLMEAMGRAIILIDEIDKHLSIGATSGTGDSGTGSRVFGTFLSWLSSRKCPIFVIATSNNLEALPPELTRKGRFDEIFWVDLPTAEERVDIFNSKLQHQFRTDLCVANTLDLLITASVDFSGAEIEAVIADALYMVLGGSKVPLRQLIKNCLDLTNPYARVDPQYVVDMRKKAAAGYKLASNIEGGFKALTSEKAKPRQLNISNN